MVVLAADKEYAKSEHAHKVSSYPMAASATANVGTKGIVRQVIGPVLAVSYTHLTLPTSDLV